MFYDIELVQSIRHLNCPIQNTLFPRQLLDNNFMRLNLPYFFHYIVPEYFFLFIILLFYKSFKMKIHEFTKMLDKVLILKEF